VVRGTFFEKSHFLRLFVTLKSIYTVTKWSTEIIRFQKITGNVLVISYLIVRLFKYLHVEYKALKFKFTLREKDFVNFLRSYTSLFCINPKIISENDLAVQVWGWSPKAKIFFVQDSQFFQLKLSRYFRKDLLRLRGRSKNFFWGFKTIIPFEWISKSQSIGKYENGLFKNFKISNYTNEQIARFININSDVEFPVGNSSTFGYIDELRIIWKINFRNVQLVDLFFSQRTLSEVRYFVNPRSQNSEIKTLSRLIIEKNEQLPRVLQLLSGLSHDSVKDSSFLLSLSLDKVNSSPSKTQTFTDIKVLGGKLILSSTLEECFNPFDFLPIPDLVSGLTFLTLPNYDFNDERIITPYKEFDGQIIERAIVLPTLPQDNWFHLILESLVSLIVETNEMHLKSTILLNEKVPHQFVDFLKLFGFNNFLYQSNYELIHVKSCILLHKSFTLPDSLQLDINEFNFNQTYLTHFKSLVHNNIDGLLTNNENSRKLSKIAVISRRKSRGITNWKTVSNLLRQEGFQVIDSSRLSLAEQIDYFRHASLIIQEGGASMANWIFCTQGTRVIYMNSTSTQFHRLPNSLAEILNIDLTRINCRIPIRSLLKCRDLYSVFHSEYKVDKRNFRRHIASNTCK
jgi:hypothetical protein